MNIKHGLVSETQLRLSAIFQHTIKQQKMCNLMLEHILFVENISKISPNTTKRQEFSGFNRCTDKACYSDKSNPCEGWVHFLRKI